MLTRRQTNGLLLGAALAPTQALALRAKQNKPESDAALAAKLEEVLNSHLIKGCNGKFTVNWLEAGQFGNDKVIDAVVKMDWPPGLRRRRFRTATPSAQTTFEDLTNEVLFEYAQAWPGCVV